MDIMFGYVAVVFSCPAHGPDMMHHHFPPR